MSASLAGEAASLSLPGEAERLLEGLLDLLRDRLRLADLHAQATLDCWRHKTVLLQCTSFTKYWLVLT